VPRKLYLRLYYDKTLRANVFYISRVFSNARLVLSQFIIWLVSWAGKMNQIQRCDWLERTRWSYFARPGLPAVSHKKNFPESHIINPYWPSLFGQDGLILASFFFCEFMDRDGVEAHKQAKKQLGQYPAILTSHLVNNPHVVHSLGFHQELSKDQPLFLGRNRIISSGWHNVEYLKNGPYFC